MPFSIENSAGGSWQQVNPRSVYTTPSEAVGNVVDAAASHPLGEEQRNVNGLGSSLAEDIARFSRKIGSLVAASGVNGAGSGDFKKTFTLSETTLSSKVDAKVSPYAEELDAYRRVSEYSGYLAIAGAVPKKVIDVVSSLSKGG